MGSRKESLYKWYRSHDQDGCHAYLRLKLSKIFSYRTNSPMIMKLCMEQYVLKLYKVYINNDPELTLTHFKTMSKLAKLVFIAPAYSKVRYRGSTFCPFVCPFVRSSVHNLCQVLTL